MSPPIAIMAGQSSRLSAFNAGTIRGPSPNQTLGPTAMVNSNWKPNGIWGSNISSALNSRETATTLRSSDDIYANGNATSAFASTQDPSNAWPRSTRPWNNVGDAVLRKPSHSPASNNIRENSQAINGVSSAYLTAIGPRSKAAAPPADASTSSFKYPNSLRENVVDDSKDINDSSHFTSFGFEADPSSMRMRTSQDRPGSFSAASTSASVSGTGSSPVSASTPGPVSASTTNNLPTLGSFGSLASSHTGHSHRSSLQNSVSYQSPVISGNTLSFHRNSQAEEAALGFTESFRKSVILDARPDMSAGTLNGGGLAGPGLSAYPSASAAVSFQFNPGSQPWDAAAAGDRNSRTGSYGGFAQDMRGIDSSLSSGAALVPGNRGSICIDRSATPLSGASFRQLNSPRGLGTSNNNGPWSRPSSRDPRTLGFSENNASATADILLQRPVTQAFLRDQQQEQYLSPGILTAGGAGAAFPIPPTPFSSLAPYSMYNSLRSPMSLQPLPMPFGAPFLPPHTSTQLPRDRDPSRAFRSQLLDDFRSNRSNRKFELSDIYNHIVEFSGDQHGSRFIQSKLETANSDEKDHVFREISVNTLVLMKDVFGNYVVQKFFEHGNQIQKKYLAEQMRGKMLDLSMQTYACRVVQKALQYILVDQQVALTKELETDVLRVVKDQNGNHVIQKIIELVPREHIGFIMDAFRGRVKELSSHNFGCRVVQRMLEHGSQEDIAAILAELHESAELLILDQYGNYVAQHVIQFGAPADRERMVEKVLARLVPLSRHKFASNVVEKCIENGSSNDRRRIVDELKRNGTDGVPVLQHMVKDQYGNYVIQKLLKQLTGEECQTFAEALSTQLTAVRRSGTVRQNAAIDRLALAVEEMTKKHTNHRAMATEDTTSSVSTTPVSPRLKADQDCTPSLTSAPNTPESSNPPSISAGPSAKLTRTKSKEASAAPTIMGVAEAACS